MVVQIDRILLQSYPEFYVIDEIVVANDEAERNAISGSRSASNSSSTLPTLIQVLHQFSNDLKQEGQVRHISLSDNQSALLLGGSTAGNRSVSAATSQSASLTSNHLSSQLSDPSSVLQECCIGYDLFCRRNERIVVTVVVQSRAVASSKAFNANRKSETTALAPLADIDLVGWRLAEPLSDLAERIDRCLLSLQVKPDECKDEESWSRLLKEKVQPTSNWAETMSLMETEIIPNIYSRLEV